MFSSDRNIETISQLITEIKRYVELRAESFEIDIVRKLSQLVAALVLGAVLFMLACLAILFVSMMAAASLDPLLGSQAVAYAIVVAFYIILGLIIYYKRKSWIEFPLTAFLAHLFLEDSLKRNKNKSQEQN